MTTEQKRKTLRRIVQVESDIAALKEVRMRLASSEYASASLASGGGSKSYTRADSGKITEAIDQLLQELKGLRALLRGSSVALPSQILTVYC